MPFSRQRAALTSVLMLVVLVFSVSCGRESEANPAARFPFAYVQNNCEPTDGLVLQFYFTEQQAENGKYDEPYIVISINENLPKSAPQDYSIKPNSIATSASRCMKPGQSEATASGNLHLAKFIEGKGASGEYELHFRDGSVERGRFDATWFRMKFLCG